MAANACLNCGCDRNQCECKTYPLNAKERSLPVFKDPGGLCTHTQIGGWEQGRQFRGCLECGDGPRRSDGSQHCEGGEAQRKAAWKHSTIVAQQWALETLNNDLEKLQKKENEPNDGASYYLRTLSIYLDDQISEKKWEVKEQVKYIKRLEEEL